MRRGNNPGAASATVMLVTFDMTVSPRPLPWPEWPGEYLRAHLLPFFLGNEMTEPAYLLPLELSRVSWRHHDVHLPSICQENFEAFWPSQLHVRQCHTQIFGNRRHSMHILLFCCSPRRNITRHHFPAYLFSVLPSLSVFKEFLLSIYLLV